MNENDDPRPIVYENGEPEPVCVLCEEPSDNWQGQADRLICDECWEEIAAQTREE